jgi:hypothetical protein
MSIKLLPQGSTNVDLEYATSLAESTLTHLDDSKICMVRPRLICLSLSSFLEMAFAAICRVMTSIPAVFRMNVEHYIIGPANFSLIGFALDHSCLFTSCLALLGPIVMKTAVNCGRLNSNTPIQSIPTRSKSRPPSKDKIHGELLSKFYRGFGRSSSGRTFGFRR